LLTLTTGTPISRDQVPAEKGFTPTTYLDATTDAFQSTKRFGVDGTSMSAENGIMTSNPRTLTSNAFMKKNIVQLSTSSRKNILTEFNILV
jgi:hypothetical protein